MIKKLSFEIRIDTNIIKAYKDKYKHLIEKYNMIKLLNYHVLQKAKSLELPYNMYKFYPSNLKSLLITPTELIHEISITLTLVHTKDDNTDDLRKIIEKLNRKETTIINHVHYITNNYYNDYPDNNIFRHIIYINMCDNHNPIKQKKINVYVYNKLIKKLIEFFDIHNIKDQTQPHI